MTADDGRVPSCVECGAPIRVEVDLHVCDRCESGRVLSDDEPHPRVCPNGLNCPCYDKPWVAPVSAPARTPS